MAKNLQEEYLEVEIVDEKHSAIVKSQASKIQDPVITTNQITALLAKTPVKYTYTRPAKGGGNWTYVSGGYVKKTLNRIFGWAWNFEIVDKWREDGEVMVQGKLTIRDKDGKTLVIKEDFGKKEIQCKKNSTTPLSIGNDYKSASTDCLKRCAYQLGLASDIYAPKEFKELENVESAIYEETSGAGKYQIKCAVCEKVFTSDKSFIKECVDCSKLSKEEKDKIISDHSEKENKKDKPF